MSIVEQLGKGLPNHFNSTDYRTVKLAKMICDILTESLKHVGGGSAAAAKERVDVMSYTSDDSLCNDVISQYCPDCCQRSQEFWIGEC